MVLKACIVSIAIYTLAQYVQWNPDITICQGSSKIISFPKLTI